MLLHAGVADRRVWNPLWSALTRRHDTTRLGPRGYGDPTQRPCGALHPVGDVVDTLAEPGIDRCHLVGASFGAGVALQLTAGWDDVDEQELDPPALVAPTGQTLLTCPRWSTLSGSRPCCTTGPTAPNRVPVDGRQDTDEVRMPKGGQAWSRLVGPLGVGESTVVLVTAAAAATAVALRTNRGRGIVRGAVAGAVAADLVGGLVAFQLSPTRQTYARTSRRSRITFALVHVQPFVLPLIADGSWHRAAARYLSAVTATVVLEGREGGESSRRAVANVVAVAASALDLLSGGSTQRWFGPVYLLKVIGGHAGIAPLRR